MKRILLLLALCASPLLAVNEGNSPVTKKSNTNALNGDLDVSGSTVTFADNQIPASAVDGLLSGQGHLLRLFSDVRGVYLNSPSTATVSVLDVGDSLSTKVSGYLFSRLAASGNYRLGGLIGDFSAASGASFSSGDYTRWPTGVVGVIPSSGTLTSGVQVASEIIEVYSVREPGGGTFQIQTSTNGSSWTTEATVNTSGVLAGIVTPVTKTRGRYYVRCVGTSGTSRVIGGAVKSTSGRSYFAASISMGGLSIANMALTPAAIVQPIVASWNPSVISFQMDDSASLVSANFPTLKSNIEGSLKPSWLVIGNGPKSSGNGGDAASRSQCDWFRANQGTYGFAFYDLMAFGGSYEALVAQSQEGDGLHLGSAFYAAAGANLCQNMAGLDLFLRSTQEIATVKARLRVAEFGRNPSAENELVNTDSAMVIQTDSSFGSDGTIDVGRALLIRAGIDSPVTVGVFSANENVWANQLPSRTYFPNMPDSLAGYSPYITPGTGGVFYVESNTPRWRNNANTTVTDLTAPPAAQVVNTPAGSIASTNVQAAINELDAEKVSISAKATPAQVAAGARGKWIDADAAMVQRWLATAATKAADPVPLMAAPATITRSGTSAVGTGTLVPWTASQFTFGGAFWSVAGGSYPDNLFGLPLRSSPAANPLGSGDVSFMYYGQSFELFCKEFLGCGFLVYVDGKLSTATLTTTAASPGDLVYYKIDMGSVALREIRIEMNGQFFFGGILPESGDRSVYKSALPVRDVAIFVGDSITQGSAADFLRGFPRQVGKIFNWDAWASGIGGTGYLVGPTIRSRLATDVYPFAPKIVVLAAGHNDNGSSAGAIETELGLVLDGLATNLPSTRVIVIGPIVQSETLAANSAYIGVRDGLAAACASHGVHFIDPLSWFTGQRGLLPGNAADFISVDDTHQNAPGHNYLGRRLSGEIADWLSN